MVANQGTKVSQHTWHDRLGHPSNSVGYQILSNSNLPYLSNNSTSCICKFCLYGKMSRLLMFINERGKMY